MSIEFKDYAKDIKLNLGAVLKEVPESNLKANAIGVTALACAYATKSQAVVDEILERVGEILSKEEKTGAKEAATIMSMNNIYYRFVHLVSDKEYGTMPAKLRMNVIGRPSISKVDFELVSLAVSAINGCGLCIDSHEKVLIKEGVSKASIQHAVKIAAVVSAVAQADFIG